MGRAAERKRLIKEELDKQIGKKKDAKNEELQEREDYEIGQLSEYTKELSGIA